MMASRGSTNYAGIVLRDSDPLSYYNGEGDPNFTYKLSAHRLNMWLQCPYKLYMYLEQYPTGPTDRKYIDNGSAVHQYLEDRMKYIEKDPEEYFKEYKVPEEMRPIFNTCIKNSEQFFKYIGEGIPEKVVHKIFQTPKGRRVDLEARIDLIADDTIFDYKTGKHVEKPEYKIQGMLYIFALNGYYPKAKFVSLQTNEVYEVSAPPENYIEKLCDKYIDTIESNEFPKKASPLCDWCDLKEYCIGKLQYVYIGDVKADPEKYGMEAVKWR